jgi:hypothetical protein
MRKGTTAATVFALMGLFALTACGEKSSEEKMDDAVDEMEDAQEEAGEAVNEALEGK